MALSGGKHRERAGGGAGEWLLFVLLVGLAFLLVFALAERAGQRERLLEVPTAAPVVPAMALSDRQDWLENGALRFTAGGQPAPTGWQAFAVTEGGAHIYRATGESFLRLECVEETCIAGLWQRLPDLEAGDYLFEADVYLEPGMVGVVSARLGYDGAGGVDPLDPEVQWSERARAQGWQRLHLDVQEDGGAGTAFLVLDVLSPAADCRVAGVRLLGPPGVGRVEITATPSPRPAAAGTDVEFRAAYLSLAGLDLADETELVSLLDGLAAAHLNVVFVQARSDGLAYYDSPLEPAAPAIAAEGGGVRWDPLARAVALGHERGLQVYAWLEALPVWPDGPDAPEPPPGHLLRAGMQRLGEGWQQAEPYLGRILASPAAAPVRAYLASTCADVAKSYGVDGLHLSGLLVTGMDGEAADSALTALLLEAVTQARAERPNLLVSVAAESGPVPDEGEAPVVQGLSPTGAWWSARLVDVVTVEFGAGTPASEPWQGLGGPVLSVLDVRASFTALADAIHAARKSGAVGIVLDDAAALRAAGHSERLAAGPFTRRALVPPALAG